MANEVVARDGDGVPAVTAPGLQVEEWAQLLADDVTADMDMEVHGRVLTSAQRRLGQLQRQWDALERLYRESPTPEQLDLIKFGVEGARGSLEALFLSVSPSLGSTEQGRARVRETAEKLISRFLGRFDEDVKSSPATPKRVQAKNSSK